VPAVPAADAADPRFEEQQQYIARMGKWRRDVHSTLQDYSYAGLETCHYSTPDLPPSPCFSSVGDVSAQHGSVAAWPPSLRK
jgi:hypothetical protein